MNFTRRTFLASFTAALLAPRLALPVPSEKERVDDNVIAYMVTTNHDVISITFRVVLWGAAAKQAFKDNPQVWSIVMQEKRIA